MKIEYSAETDILYMEFQEGVAAETCDLDENTLLDLMRKTTSVQLLLSMLQIGQRFRSSPTSRSQPNQPGEPNWHRVEAFGALYRMA
jgi:Protein of unknown function (DUF2283)